MDEDIYWIIYEYRPSNDYYKYQLLQRNSFLDTIMSGFPIVCNEVVGLGDDM